jgi:hypothetical protein
MRAVYKYPIASRVMMPKGAKILHLGHQDDVMYFWVEIDTEEKIHEVRRFFVAGTGQVVPSDEKMTYRGTVILHAGAYVFHVFEEGYEL